MAFPVPDHLPRAVPQDISTRILSKVASASTKTLTADLASSWISDLDDTILQTKVRRALQTERFLYSLCTPQTRIYERIHADLPAFEEQLATSRSAQERLRTLTSNVDALGAAVSHPEVRASRA
jgi:centromere/kinetochore protein ZW10